MARSTRVNARFASRRLSSVVGVINSILKTVFKISRLEGEESFYGNSESYEIPVRTGRGSITGAHQASRYPLAALRHRPSVPSGERLGR